MTQLLILLIKNKKVVRDLVLVVPSVDLAVNPRSLELLMWPAITNLPKARTE
jgi:hypothetical protein